MAGRAKKRTPKPAQDAPEAAPAAKPAREVLKLVPPPPPKPELVFTRLTGEFVGPGLVAARDLIAKACSRTGGRYSSETIGAAVLAGVFQLWAAVDTDGRFHAVVLTHRAVYDTGLHVLQLMLAAGSGLSRDDALEAIDELREFALSRQCEKIEFYGARRGWLRWLKRLGIVAFDDHGVCGEVNL